MKRYAMLLAAVLVLLAANLCSAARLPDAGYALGGIKFGDDAEFAKSVYGEPDWVDYHEGTPNSGDIPLWIYHYGDSFVVAVEATRMSVSSLMTTANNGIATPRGIHVGSTLTDIQRAYGTLPQGHRANQGYCYSYGWGAISLDFYVDGKGKVYKIWTGYSD